MGGRIAKTAGLSTLALVLSRSLSLALLCSAAQPCRTVADGQARFCDGWHNQVRPDGGSYRQGGCAIKLVLQRILLADCADRPWSPRPFFPYRPGMFCRMKVVL